jgi:hypothetical protein
MRHRCAERYSHFRTQATIWNCGRTPSCSAVPRKNSLSHFAAATCVFQGECTEEDSVAGSTVDVNRVAMAGQAAGDSPDGPISRKEVVSILAETLLEMLVPGAERMSASARNPLISGSQHALVLTENTVRKRRSQRGRRGR